MTPVQPAILMPVPRHARYLDFGLAPGVDATDALRSLARAADPLATVVGIGRSTVLSLGREIPGLRDFTALTGRGLEIPSTPSALWCWLRGDDRGELLHRARALETTVSGAFRLDAVIDAFQFGDSRDLTGYEDGTENPEGDDAIEAAVLRGAGAGLDGSSFVAVQQWVHDLDRFQCLPVAEQDATFGRRRSDNEEIDDAPPSAHVKRTAQESFAPEAFVVRRSMPWSDDTRAGLVFVAFGRAFDAFEVQMRRMAGIDDGITDALFRFTRPVTGAFYWCPPVAAKGGLDLRALGL